LDDEEREKVAAGDSVKLKLKGVEDSDIMAGFVLCSPDTPCPVAHVFDAEVTRYMFKFKNELLITNCAKLSY
jgi:translation elongation factor EF-1alpha